MFASGRYHDIFLSMAPSMRYLYLQEECNQKTKIWPLYPSLVSLQPTIRRWSSTVRVPRTWRTPSASTEWASIGTCWQWLWHVLSQCRKQRSDHLNTVVVVKRTWHHYGGLTSFNEAETAAKRVEAQLKIWRSSCDISLAPMVPNHPFHNISTDHRYHWGSAHLFGESEGHYC